MILEVRDIWPQILIDMDNMSEKSLTYKVLKKMERILYRNSELIIALSKGSIKYIQSEGGREIDYFPNYSNTDLFNYSTLPLEDSKFSSTRPFRIIYSGAHGVANDLVNVVRAAYFLKDLPIEIILVGDGPEKSNLKKLAQELENVFFRDPVPKKDVPVLLSSADAILISLADVRLFEYGVSPNKLFDAYAVGRPVIITINGIINEEVKNYNLGMVAPPGQPEKLSEAIIKLFKKNRSERVIISLNSKMMVEKFYSKDLILNKYVDRIAKLIKENQKATTS